MDVLPQGLRLKARIFSHSPKETLKIRFFRDLNERELKEGQ
jgi:hypothetical protein